MQRQSNLPPFTLRGTVKSILVSDNECKHSTVRVMLVLVFSAFQKS